MKTNAPYTPVVVTDEHEAETPHLAAKLFVLFAVILAFGCLFAIPIIGL